MSKQANNAPLQANNGAGSICNASLHNSKESEAVCSPSVHNSKGFQQTRIVVKTAANGN